MGMCRHHKSLSPIKLKNCNFPQSTWSVLCNPYLFQVLCHLKTINRETEIPTGLKQLRTEQGIFRHKEHHTDKVMLNTVFFLTLLPWLKQVITAFSLVKPSKWIDFNDLRIHDKYPTERPCTAPFWTIRHFSWHLYLLSNLQRTARIQRQLSHFIMLSIQFHSYLMIVYSFVHSHIHKYVNSLAKGMVRSNASPASQQTLLCFCKAHKSGPEH